MPLSGLSICAVGNDVAVREGASRWHAESGQYLLAFEGDPANGSLSVIEPRPAEPSPGAQDWFERGLTLEGEDADAALQAYEHAVAADPALLDAHVNRGRLLHEAGRLAQAERVYREAIGVCGADPLLLFNL